MLYTISSLAAICTVFAVTSVKSLPTAASQEKQEETSSPRPDSPKPAYPADQYVQKPFVYNPLPNPFYAAQYPPPAFFSENPATGNGRPVSTKGAAVKPNLFKGSFSIPPITFLVQQPVPSIPLPSFHNWPFFATSQQNSDPTNQQKDNGGDGSGQKSPQPGGIVPLVANVGSFFGGLFSPIYEQIQANLPQVKIISPGFEAYDNRPVHYAAVPDHHTQAIFPPVNLENIDPHLNELEGPESNPKVIIQ